MTREETLRVPCPTCEAEAGASCWLIRGKHVGQVWHCHVARKRAAVAALARGTRLALVAHLAVGGLRT